MRRMPLHAPANLHAATHSQEVSMQDLNQRDMMQAVTNGVREAFIEAMTSTRKFDLPHELVCEAIRKGMADAIWKIATHAGDDPSGEFYSVIKAGVGDAMARFRP